MEYFDICLLRKTWLYCKW